MSNYTKNLNLILPGCHQVDKAECGKGCVLLLDDVGNIAPLVGHGFAFLDGEHEVDDTAHQRNEVNEEPPARTADVVHASYRQAECGKQYAEIDYSESDGRECFAPAENDGDSNHRDENEKHEPPVFRP